MNEHDAQLDHTADTQPGTQAIGAVAADNEQYFHEAAVERTGEHARPAVLEPARAAVAPGDMAEIVAGCVLTTLVLTLAVAAAVTRDSVTVSGRLELLFAGALVGVTAARVAVLIDRSVE